MANGMIQTMVQSEDTGRTDDGPTIDAKNKVKT